MIKVPKSYFYPYTITPLSNVDQPKLDLQYVYDVLLNERDRSIDQDLYDWLDLVEEIPNPFEVNEPEIQIESPTIEMSPIPIQIKEPETNVSIVVRTMTRDHKKQKRPSSGWR